MFLFLYLIPSTVPSFKFIKETSAISGSILFSKSRKRPFTEQSSFIKDNNGVADTYVFTLEDHRRETGLGGFIASLGFKNPVRVGCRNYAQSARTLEDMQIFHKLTVDELCAVIRKVTSCKDHK